MSSASHLSMDVNKPGSYGIVLEPFQGKQVSSRARLSLIKSMAAMYFICKSTIGGHTQ